MMNFEDEKIDVNPAAQKSVFLIMFESRRSEASFEASFEGNLNCSCCTGNLNEV